MQEEKVTVLLKRISLKAVHTSISISQLAILRWSSWRKSQCVRLVSRIRLHNQNNALVM
jgi:hypothetical protein